MEEKKDEEKEEAEEEKEEKPKQPEQTERPEPPENLDKELEKLLKEKPEPMKKSKAPPESEKKKKDPDLPEKKGVLSLPFKVKINLPGRKKKEKDIEEVRKEGKKEVAKKKIALDKIELTGKSRSEMIKQLIVADVMSTDPITVKPDDKLSFVVRLFSNKKISGAPVVVEHNIVGLISKSDIVKVIGIKDVLDIDTPAFEKLENSKVSDVMKKKVYFVRKYNKLSEAADIMNKNDINLLPVVDNKKRIIGIVSRGDIVRVVSKELLAKLVQQQRQAMKKMTKIETDIDTVLDMVEQAGSISILEISERMTIHEDRIEDWAKTMEKEGLLEIFYPAFGSPVLRKKLRKDVISFEEEES
jgi:CBS-domain-containing membrane protein